VSVVKNVGQISICCLFCLHFKRSSNRIVMISLKIFLQNLFGPWLKN